MQIICKFLLHSIFLFFITLHILRGSVDNNDNKNFLPFDTHAAHKIMFQYRTKQIHNYKCNSLPIFILFQLIHINNNKYS